MPLKTVLPGSLNLRIRNLMSNIMTLNPDSKNSHLIYHILYVMKKLVCLEYTTYQAKGTLSKCILTYQRNHVFCILLIKEIFRPQKLRAFLFHFPESIYYVTTLLMLPIYTMYLIINYLYLLLPLMAMQAYAF